MLGPLLLAALAMGSAPGSFDWVTTGTDCEFFACGDLDHDGFDDVVTINGAHDLCVAYNVHGWKSATWEVLAHGMPEGVVGLEVIATDVKRVVDVAVATREKVLLYVGGTSAGIEWQIPKGEFVARTQQRQGELWIETVSGHDFVLHTSATNFSPTIAPPSRGEDREVAPPPYDGKLAPRRFFHGDIDGDKLDDTLAVFDATRPYPHRVVRVTLAPAALDSDADGLSDAEEAALGTDPFDRDTDHDGLLDGWEVKGLPRGVAGPETKLDPRHQDVIVAISRYEQLKEEDVRAELEKSKGLYARLATHNPDGTDGIRLQYVWLPPVPLAQQGNWPEVGDRCLDGAARGLMHWMQITPGGGGQAQQCGDRGQCGNHWAAFAHELGHQLGLSHTGDSEPAWCPLYPSIMNYAFNYGFDGDGAKIHFSDGRFASAELREDALVERLPFPIAQLSYLSKSPFFFTLKEDGEHATRIDWNQDGVFEDTPVQADVNYGGSTYCGIRRNVEKVGAGPALGRVGDVIWLASVALDHSSVSLRAYEGNEKWSEPRVVAKSATQDQPVLAGTKEAGSLFVRQGKSWSAARFDASETGALVPLEGFEDADLSAVTLGGRVLLVRRAQDGTLATCWFADASSTPGPALDFTSDVPVALAEDPTNGHLVVVGSGPNADQKPSCMRVAWFELRADGSFAKLEQRIVGGEHDVVHCTTRPVARVSPEGQLTIFHTGWRDANGLGSAYRTQRIANTSLRDGWLVCLLYDVWTSTTVPVAYERGPQGAVYAYRWNSGGDNADMLQVAHEGRGIDRAPMRDFDDGALMSQWGIRHSILYLRRSLNR